MFQLRVHGKRKDPFRLPLGFRQRTLSAAQVCIRWLKVQRNRIVQARTDILFCEIASADRRGLQHRQQRTGGSSIGSIAVQMEFGDYPRHGVTGGSFRQVRGAIVPLLKEGQLDPQAEPPASHRVVRCSPPSDDGISCSGHGRESFESGGRDLRRW